MRTKEIRFGERGTKYVPPRLVEGSRWYIEYWAWSDQKGKLIRKRNYAIPGSSVREKRALAKQMMAEISRLLHYGHVLDAAPVEQPKTLRLQEAFELALKIKRKEVGTKAKADYKSYFGVFSIWLQEAEKASLPVTSFRSADAYQFLDWLLQVRGSGNSTRNNYRQFMASLTNVLVSREIIPTNPFKGIPELKVNATKHVPYTPEERALLLDYLKKENPDLYYFVQFIYYGFIRRSELLKLRVRDIDLSNRIIMVWSGNAKNKRQLPIVINPGLMRIMEEMNLPQYAGRQYVFGRLLERGEIPSPVNYPTNKHSQALKEIGLYDGERTLYSHKHSGVCAAYRAGVDIYSIMRQCRHYSLQETENYMRSMGLRISSELKNTEW